MFGVQGPSSEVANKESWTDRVPALSAAVTQMSNTLSTLKQRTAQVWQSGKASSCTSLDGHPPASEQGLHVLAAGGRHCSRGGAGMAAPDHQPDRPPHRRSVRLPPRY